MVWNKIKIFLEMIKFEHTIFALPFAYLGAFLATGGIPSGHNFLWITVAMVGARTAAMALNRIIDRQIDAKNPRTANRAIPKGLLTAAEVWIFVLISFTMLMVAAFQLNPLNRPVPLSAKLLPVAVFFLVIYSYTKRFTWLCHLVLGTAIGIAPAGSWVAVTGKFELPAALMWAAVATWIAGFDIIYACQDFEFDRNEGIKSIPARFGIKKALSISAFLHVLTIILFVILGIYFNLGTFYWLGVVVAAAILYYEHSLVTADDLSKLDLAFFNMNGILSVLVFAFTTVDIIIDAVK